MYESDSSGEGLGRVFWVLDILLKNQDVHIYIMCKIARVSYSK